MVPRRVIADSDDEDGEDNPLSPLGEDEGINRPEVEPLSPRHRPSSPDVLDAHNHISDTTDQSFFASVYDEQQNRALHQSHLIENIVRQSQQASRSSGEVSLPKSASGEWDVPSSAEDAMVSRTTKSLKGKNEKSYGKRRRSQSKATKSSAAAEIFMGYDDDALKETAQDTTLHNEMLAPSHRTGPSPLPVFKRNEVSLNDSVVQDTAPIANFYIAQSNLTTMQKLEYEKVNVSQNGYPGLKSSGMSTVAYPTPSRYASSSGPPLPWERDLAADAEPDESVDFINIMSSPDVIAADHGYMKRNPVEAALVDTQVAHDEVEPPVRDTTPKSPYSRRKKRARSIQDEDEDELQDGPRDYEAVDRHQDKHKRRRNEPKSNPPSPHGDDDIRLLPNPHEEILGEQDYQDLPREEPHRTGDAASEIPATAPPPASFNALEHNLPETQPTPQPKKRGRKKKQVVKEQILQEELPVENQAAAQEIPPAVKDPEVQIGPEKPKKKRGRPRKSDLAKPETAPAPEHDPHVTHKAHEDDAQHSEMTSEKIEATEKRKPKKKQKPQSEVEGKEEEDPTTDKDDVEDALKEINSNSRPSEEPVSAEEVPAKPTPKQLADQHKSNEKGSTVPKPISTSSQPKVPYRVGLSKRTRIASLLKIIKK
ncbi:hypothetical protein F5Y00DRAFT_206511 [Daldinia vernicosa]|uniref:uncharacterized protein n=1 Tax=Daldinia vernicosa TaxID=114800 RepID=UPI002007CFE5|nr:uncharacterized protein F5Y00DRAFT_206511 [Daldinia vernicosa]KAI0852079.1 hypothetical protein F5Y00DRAFT_206511 [Daldinia vernicosa]